MAARRGRNITRKTKLPINFHWLPEPLMPKITKKKKFRKRGCHRTVGELVRDQKKVGELIRAGSSVTEILNELNLNTSQLNRHARGLIKGKPKEAWRYERLLNEKNKTKAYKLNLVYDLRRKGLTGREIEGLLDLDSGNSRHYLSELKEYVGVNKEKKEFLTGVKSTGAGRHETILKREALVVRAVFGESSLKQIDKALDFALGKLDEVYGLDRDRVVVAIRTLRKLKSEKK